MHYIHSHSYQGVSSPPPGTLCIKAPSAPSARSTLPSNASNGSLASACEPLRLLVRPQLIGLSDVEKSPDVLTCARSELHILPASLDRMVVPRGIFLVHPHDQVLGTLDGSEDAIESCSSRRDSYAEVAAGRARSDLKGISHQH